MTIKTIISPDDGHALAVGMPQFVEGGVVVSNSFFPVPPFLIFDGAPPDGRAYTWRRVGDVWEAVLPVLTIEELAVSRSLRWEAIKAARDRRKTAGVKVGENWFHSDDGSRIQWLGLKDQARDVIAAGGTNDTVLQRLGRDIMWKTMSGTFVPATAGLAFAVVDAVGDLDAMAFGAAEQHRVAMEASTDPAAYDFSTGWPQAFGE